MTAISYTLSNTLQKTLEEIDEKRKILLLTPLTPATELKFRWTATLDRVYFSLLLSGFKVTPGEITKTLTSSLLKKPKKLSNEQKMILKYKKSLDQIYMNWLADNKPLDYRFVKRLHEVGANGSYKKKDEELKQILDYIQKGEDHPVVQAAIIYAGIKELHGFSDGNGRLSRLLSLVFLYRAGYDFRGFVTLEEQWAGHPEEFKEALDQGINNAHMTVWIEYFALTLLAQIDSVLSQIQINSLSPKEKSFSSLNERQKEILMLLEEPNLSITNRKVQELFDVSQITASRDLARLATLGLLIPHGRGRSVYYTRV